MDWGSLIAFALLLSVAAFALYLAWLWLLALLLWGIPAYIGIVTGWYAGSIFENAALGLAATVLVTGVLGTSVSVTLRGIRKAC